MKVHAAAENGKVIHVLFLLVTSEIKTKFFNFRTVMILNYFWSPNFYIFYNNNHTSKSALDILEITIVKME